MIGPVESKRLLVQFFMQTPVQFSHWLSCIVVVYLVPATIYGRLLNEVGGRFPTVLDSH